MTSSSSLVRPRTFSHRNPLGRYYPKVVTDTTRWRFIRTRRAEYVRRLTAEPDERQALIITQMIDAEWNAFICERKADQETIPRQATEALRLAAEFRRQLMLLDRELATTTRQAAAAEAERQKRAPNLDEYLAMVAAARANTP